METRTRGKGTIDHGLRGSMGTLDDVNPTRLSKRSQGCPLIVIIYISFLFFFFWTYYTRKECGKVSHNNVTYHSHMSRCHTVTSHDRVT